MNILQIAPKLPFPLNEGGRIGIYNITKQLALEGANVYFAAISENPAREDLGDLHKWCKDILIARHVKSHIVSSAASNVFSRIPLNIERFHSFAVLSQVKEFASRHSIDLIHTDHLHMAFYGLALKKFLSKPAVLREHNLEMKIMERFAQTQTELRFKLFARMQLQKLLKYEPSTCSLFDLCVMISRQDREHLLKLSPLTRTEVIPAGVDVKHFCPNNHPKKGQTIGYVGSLDWFANIQGLRWFIKEVFPIIRQTHIDTKFLIYGSNPDKKAFELADGMSVLVRGPVGDVRDAYESATVFIAPERIGSGIRLKILEAMAMGKPIVATSVSCEGIEAEHGKALLVADKPLDFARHVSSLLSSQRLRRSLSVNARRTVVNQYSWTKVGKQFARTYQRILDNYERN